MEYILSHKGTTENLFILADNVLSEFSIALIAKYIYQQQTDRYDECRRTPEIISKQLISYLRSEHQSGECGFYSQGGGGTV